MLTHRGRVTHICVSDITIIASDNGLSPGRRQAIIRTNAGILLIRPLGTYFSEILIEIVLFSFKEMRLKISSAKMWPFCLGHNVLTHCCGAYICQWAWIVDQSWRIINWAPEKPLQWIAFIKTETLKNVVCKISDTLYRHRYGLFISERNLLLIT